jgi:nicotinate-nucleotide adenylyltransferase
LAKHHVYVYPRAYVENEAPQESPKISHPHIHVINEVPVLSLSASMIRTMLAKEQDCSFLLTEKVLKYIDERGLYK